MKAKRVESKRIENVLYMCMKIESKSNQCPLHTCMKFFKGQSFNFQNLVNSYFFSLQDFFSQIQD